MNSSISLQPPKHYRYRKTCEKRSSCAEKGEKAALESHDSKGLTEERKGWEREERPSKYKTLNGGTLAFPLTFSANPRWL
ncbi:hypothetical protein QL285_042226 [Trifolium repens]|nr:hypothetical protein QL285_042226 [Trifolium repens]